MRVLVATADMRGEDPQGVVAALRELGCDVVVTDFDLDGVHEADLARTPPNLLLVEAGDRLTSGVVCLKSLRALAVLADVPALVAVATSKLALLDFSIADDFVLLPVVPAELYARVRQLDWRTSSFTQEERLKLGELLIDVAGYEAFVGARRLRLTRQEFELLKFLAQNRGRVFTREQLLARVWGYRYDGGSRTVDIHVRRVRAKLGALADLIQTVRNVGYKASSLSASEPAPHASSSPVEAKRRPRARSR